MHKRDANHWQAKTVERQRRREAKALGWRLLVASIFSVGMLGALGGCSGMAASERMPEPMSQMGGMQAKLAFDMAPGSPAVDADAFSDDEDGAVFLANQGPEVRPGSSPTASAEDHSSTNVASAKSAKPKGPQQKGPQQKGPAKRLVIYTASMAVLVANAEVALNGFLEKTEAIGGYLQKRNQQTVTVRVPARHFDALVKSLAAFGQITSRAIDSQDVTAQFRDLSIRIDNANRSRLRLLALLEKAVQVEDILRIEKELRRLTEEIELMEGQRRGLSDRISYSTVTVRFDENAPQVRSVPYRNRSRFWWINSLGAENVVANF